MNENEQLLAFCSALRAARTKMGHSQDTFADFVGMHRAYYSALERGEKNITFKTLSRLTSGLGIAPSTLFKSAGL